MAKSFSNPSLSIAALILATSDLDAQSRHVEEQLARLRSSEHFGEQCCQILQLPASSFVPMHSLSTWTTNQNGYVDASEALRATVTLPTGAAIEYLNLYYYDADTTYNVCARLLALTGPTIMGDPPGKSILAETCTPHLEAPGYGYSALTVSETIFNNVFSGTGAQYVIEVDMAGDTAFKAVDLWWHRQVSPPTGVATFNDVPTGHPQFQFVEALAESAITVGCGGGNYCPDAPLTRGQMAVFLAKALGLYWQY
jgi:hypothetical protein